MIRWNRPRCLITKSANAHTRFGTVRSLPIFSIIFCHRCNKMNIKKKIINIIRHSLWPFQCNKQYGNALEFVLMLMSHLSNRFNCKSLKNCWKCHRSKWKTTVLHEKKEKKKESLVRSYIFAFAEWKLKEIDRVSWKWREVK